MDITSYPKTPRLVNRYMIGADPEFTFADAYGRYIHAEQAGMNTLRAFGCDMAGRQAEVRAFPSRFALEVVASVVDTLRWMQFAHGADLGGMNWIATAWNGVDGCGGHVHLGRRRGKIEKETAILDDVTQAFNKAAVFDQSNFTARMAHTNYGRLGDIRQQAHGYEYRTFPTQLDSPWLMYLTLVISKLAVYDGTNFYSHPKKLPSSEEIVHLLTKYKDLDDDAAIALKCYKLQGLPYQTGKHFRAKWGVGDVGGMPASAVSKHHFPSVIEAHESTKRELFDLFTHGTALPLSAMMYPNWAPYKLPEEVRAIGVSPHTLGHLPDVGTDLLCKFCSVGLSLGPTLHIETNVPLNKSGIREALKEIAHDVRFASLKYPLDEPKRIISISVPKGINTSKAHCKLLKSVLSNFSLFPVCKAKDLGTVDWSEWTTLLKKPVIEKKKIGQFLGTIKSRAEEPAVVPQPKARMKAPSLQQAAYAQFFIDAEGRMQPIVPEREPGPRRIFNDE